ncbi:MAG: hypothetical protein D6731_23280 [Planctomycetota bacterium]|nr:MAG: hypothetical protein D6731_23280 [Planctomycetota bacterium]
MWFLANLRGEGGGRGGRSRGEGSRFASSAASALERLVRRFERGRVEGQRGLRCRGGGVFRGRDVRVAIGTVPAKGREVRVAISTRAEAGLHALRAVSGGPERYRIVVDDATGEGPSDPFFRTAPEVRRRLRYLFRRFPVAELWSEGSWLRARTVRGRARDVTAPRLFELVQNLHALADALEAHWGAQRVNVRVRPASSGRCPYCHEAMAPREAVARCEGCGTEHHAECFQELGRCVSLGCGCRRATLRTDASAEAADEHLASTPCPRCGESFRGCAPGRCRARLAEQRRHARRRGRL